MSEEGAASALIGLTQPSLFGEANTEYAFGGAGSRKNVKKLAKIQLISISVQALLANSPKPFTLDGIALHGFIHRGVTREHPMQPDDLDDRLHRRLHVRQPNVALLARLLQPLQRRDERAEAGGVDEIDAIQVDDD